MDNKIRNLGSAQKVRRFYIWGKCNTDNDTCFLDGQHRIEMWDFKDFILLWTEWGNRPCSAQWRVQNCLRFSQISPIVEIWEYSRGGCKGMGATLDKYHSVMLLKSITIKSMVLDHWASKWYVLYLINTCGNTREEKKDETRKRDCFLLLYWSMYCYIDSKQPQILTHILYNKALWI